jgi:hypothetical protein
MQGTVCVSASSVYRQMSTLAYSLRTSLLCGRKWGVCSEHREGPCSERLIS